ncbi:MAG: lysostaphin resistance A-like protein [Bacilli bacterium]
MDKRNTGILLSYIGLQFSPIIGYPILIALLGWGGTLTETQQAQLTAYWAVGSFLLVALLVGWLVRTGEVDWRNKPTLDLSEKILWVFGGFVLALVGQGIAGYIETQLFGIPAGSENTFMLMDIAKQFPLFIAVIVLIGPFLEEVVFRKVIFGTLYKRFNFFIAASISSLAFAVMHLDFTHLLIYFVMGFTFAFLYKQTKRIWVPVAAHMLMNGFVVLMQMVFAPLLQQMQ